MFFLAFLKQNARIIRSEPDFKTSEEVQTTFDPEVTKLLSSCWPSHYGRSDTLGRMDWANRPVSAKSHFLCHSLNKSGLAKLWKSHGDSGLSKMEPFNDAYRSSPSTSSLLTNPTWDGIHISFTSIKSLIRTKHNCLPSYTDEFATKFFWTAYSLDRTQAIC
jgi:hypothetical protein